MKREIIAINGNYTLYFDCKGLDSSRSGDYNAHPAFAWYDYTAKLRGSPKQAKLCACVTENGDDESGTGEGGHWPDNWDKEAYDAFCGAILADARKRGYPERMASE